MTVKMPVSDEAVRARTGCDWARWRAALDRAGARGMTHREIVALVAKRWRVGPWWRQMVTVGYERMTGRRAVHETARGYAMSASRTIAAGRAAAYRAWTDARARAAWLPRKRVTVRTAIRPRSLRITWPDGTDVLVGITAHGAGKCVVAVSHEKLRGAAGVRAAKAFWSARLDALKAALER